MTVSQFANGLASRVGSQLMRINRLSAVAAIQEVKGEFTQRIFQKGKDSNNGIIGKYRSKTHINARKNYGRQTRFKDYNFTGSLFASVKIVNALNSVALAIVDSPEVDKSISLEKQDKKKVFDLSKQELQNITDYRILAADKLIKQIQL